MTPFFSVIVPVYKAEAYLRACVDSILTQTFADFELILVDDGSPDGSGAICDEYAKKDSRVQALHQKNAGPTPARRAGLERARGEYVCFVDGDDRVVPHWLGTAKERIDESGADVVLYDHERDTGPAEQPLLLEGGFYDKARLEAEVYPWMLCDVRRRPFGTQLFPGMLWSKAIKRQLLADHFITDDRINVFEDAAMSYDCVYHARSMYVIPQPLYIYRQVEQSNLGHYRPDFFRQLKMGQDYMLSTLGGVSPALDRQISGFYVRKVLVGIGFEYSRCGSVPAAARAVGRALRQTGLMKGISARGLPAFVHPYVWLLKCRLYLPAVLVTALALDPDPAKRTKGDDRP